MSPSIHLFRWISLLLLATSLAVSTPAPASPACGGNVCYPILIGPVLKDIAKDYCSYYLKYPRTTTVTAKTTSTVTKGFTKPAQTVSTTVTTQRAISTTATSTATVPGETVTSNVTETVTVNGLTRRDPSPLFTPPKGSGDGYKLPLLVPFAPAVISAACSCIISPSTTTVTSTSRATATTTQTVTQPDVRTTAGTVTTTQTVTVTNTATRPIHVHQVTADPSTSTTTTTTSTTAAPAQTCNGDPGTPQRAVTGYLKPIATDYPPRLVTPSRIATAEACYTFCKNFTPPFPDNPPPPIRAYTYNATQTRPGQDFPGFCACYTAQVCFVLDNDPAGDTNSGDIALPF